MSWDAAAIRAAFPAFDGPEPFVYLDSAATAQVVRPALDAQIAYETGYRANVKRGIYPIAEKATDAFDRARSQVASHLGESDPDAVALLAGATLALNTAALALGERLGPGDVIVVTEAEHHANLVPWRMLADRKGLELRALPVLEDGSLDLNALDRVLDGRVRLISVGHVSNVTGAEAPIAPIAEAARAKGAYLAIDGAQMAPHGPIDVAATGADLYAISGHKCFSTTGAGALWLGPRLRADLPPALGGGEMIRNVSIERVTFAPAPHRFEAGTPPIGAAIALGAALAWLGERDRAAMRAHERDLTRRMIEGLATLGARVIGPGENAARYGVVSFDLPGFHPHDVAQLLGECGVCVRAGHHCAQPLMRALDLDATTRASLGPYSSIEDVDAMLESVERAKEVLA